MIHVCSPDNATEYYRPGYTPQRGELYFNTYRACAFSYSTITDFSIYI